MSAAEPLCFPEKVMEAHAAVLGKTGAGKSSGMRHVVEHLLSRKKRVAIIDPKGDWWGLKSSADGKGPGFPVVAFGDFKSDQDVADVPINEQSGKDVAELIIDGNRPAIIGFRGWYTAHMLRFWIDFAKGIFHGNRGEFYLFVDEVQNFAPKGSTRTIEGQGGLSLHWTNRLLAEGRGLGINIWIGSQRPQKVHNDTLDGCETLVAMRSVHPAARGALNTWMQGAADKEKSAVVLDALGSMKRGEAIIWSPEIEFGPEAVTFPMFTTFDSFAPPQLQKKVHRKGWASVDLDVVKAKLAQIVEEKELNDPAKLHQRIHELERSLTQMEGRVRDAGDEKMIGWLTSEMQWATEKLGREVDDQWDVSVFKATVELAAERSSREIPVFKPGEFESIEDMENRLTALAREFWERLEAFQATMNSAGAAAMHPNNQGREMAPVKSSRSPGQGLKLGSKEPPLKPALSPKVSFTYPYEGVTAPQQRVLNALQWWHLAGIEAPNRYMLAFAAKFKVGGYFTDLVSSMKTAELVSYPSPGVVTLTGKGQSLCDPSTETPTRRRLIEMTLETIKKEPQRKIFRACVDAWPDDLNREELAERAGFKVGGYFTDLVSSVKTAGLIEYPTPGRVKLAQLFSAIR